MISMWAALDSYHTHQVTGIFVPTRVQLHMVLNKVQLQLQRMLRAEHLSISVNIGEFTTTALVKSPPLLHITPTASDDHQYYFSSSPVLPGITSSAWDHQSCLMWPLVPLEGVPGECVGGRASQAVAGRGAECGRGRYLQHTTPATTPAHQPYKLGSK